MQTACAVLHAFALDLVERGTKRKKNLASTTPSDYLNALADDFHVALNEVRLYGINETTYAEIFRKLVNGSATMSPARIAALKALHQFLRAWWQVPPLPTGLLQVEVEANVRANLVWPHEKERLREWLAGDAQADRFVAQLGAALGKLSAMRLCALVNSWCCALAMFLMKGIIWWWKSHAGCVTAERSHAGGRRRVMVCDTTAMAIVRTWLARRAAELAIDQDYLFGQPDRPTELAHAGKMYFWLNRLLKTVTGDENISLHFIPPYSCQPTLGRDATSSRQ